MEEIKFRNLNELYNRIYPALESKRKELHHAGLKYIYEEDIWNCCKELIWNNSRNLGLYDIVDNILNTDNSVFDKYLKDIVASKHREINKDDTDERKYNNF